MRPHCIVFTFESLKTYYMSLVFFYLCALYFAHSAGRLTVLVSSIDQHISMSVSACYNRLTPFCSFVCIRAASLAAFVLVLPQLFARGVLCTTVPLVF